MNKDRLKPYSGKMVAVQLRRPLYMLSYGGTAMLDGVEQHGVVPAMFPPMTEGEQGSAVGFAEILPAAIIEVTDVSVLLCVVDPATRARLSIDVPPEEILYVTSVAQPPSQIIKP